MSSFEEFLCDSFLESLQIMLGKGRVVCKEKSL